jgi:outer membrane protein OmpA-like peptidoglycan-associated protein
MRSYIYKFLFVFLIVTCDIAYGKEKLAKRFSELSGIIDKVSQEVEEQYQQKDIDLAQGKVINFIAGTSELSKEELQSLYDYLSMCKVKNITINARVDFSDDEYIAQKNLSVTRLMLIYNILLDRNFSPQFITKQIIDSPKLAKDGVFVLYK